MRKIIELIIAFTSKLRDDYIYAFSANASFFIIISFFPFAIFFLTLLRYLPMFAEGMPPIWLDLFPQQISDLINLVLSEVNPSGTILSVSAVLTLWSASVGMLSISRGLNKIYGISETRNYLRIRIISIFHTLIFMVLIIATMVLFVFGNRISTWIFSSIPAVSDITSLVKSIRTIAGFGLLLFFFLFMFCTLPNRKANLTKELPGAVLAAAGWLVFSYLFSFYVDNITNYTATYGSLTAVVVCMLWFYFCMFIMFLGAELNSCLFNPVVRRSLHHGKERSSSTLA